MNLGRAEGNPALYLQAKRGISSVKQAGRMGFALEAHAVRRGGPSGRLSDLARPIDRDVMDARDRDYAELVVKHSLALLARLTTTTRIIDSWAQLPGGAH